MAGTAFTAAEGKDSKGREGKGRERGRERRKEVARQEEGWMGCNAGRAREEESALSRKAEG